VDLVVVREITEIESTLVMVEGIDELIIQMRNCIAIQCFKHNLISFLLVYFEIDDISSD
jgi:hypothetical protein